MARLLMRGPIAGRDAELASLHDFVASISDGAGALVLEGEAGVGKTTVWEAALASAEEGGLLVLRARTAESETALGFSGLRDLLDPVADDALAGLPELQRGALARALLLADDDAAPGDAHAIGVALLNAVRSLAASRPLLLAVDDVQWLDAESAGALAYAARRLRGEPVGVVLTRRTGLESGLVAELGRSLDRFREVAVEPLDVEALHHVVQRHLDLTLPPPLLADVHAASGGNPFYALEIVRFLRRKDVLVEAGKPLPVPESLHDLVHGRLLALPAASRDYLLAAAAEAQPTPELVEAATPVARKDALEPAVEAGVVELDAAASASRIHCSPPASTSSRSRPGGRRSMRASPSSWTTRKRAGGTSRRPSASPTAPSPPRSKTRPGMPSPAGRHALPRSSSRARSR